jgi:hypothetical protein
MSNSHLNATTPSGQNVHETQLQTCNAWRQAGAACIAGIKWRLCLMLR